MPKNKSAVVRYHVINDCLRSKRHPFPTLEFLAKKCSDVLFTDISMSTIEKDIAAMKQPEPIGYNAPIVYSKIEKGYVYSEKGFSISELNLEDNEWEALNFAAQLLHQYKNVPIFANFKSAIERINTRFSLGFTQNEPIINQKVQFEKAVDTKGLEWINSLYEAISKKHAVQFSYQNIYKKEIKQYVLIPYLLKEHRNRWYLIGWSNDREKYVTFGLDRLFDLTIIEEPQKLRTDFDPSKFFQYATGIMETATQPELVELTVLHPISELISLEPLHDSQTIIHKDEIGIQLQITVLVNEELFTRILSMGANCIVHQPTSLKLTIKERINNMQQHYR